MRGIQPDFHLVRLFLLALALSLPMARIAAHAETAPMPATPPGDREVTIANHSKQAINEVYVSPANDSDFGDDRLGDDTIDAGDTYRVKLGRMRECVFDIHIVYEDGSKEQSLGANLCRTRQLAFDGSTAVAPPPREEHAVVIVDNAARPIQKVFISPAESTDWGDDHLADDTISVGASKTVTYRGDCVADLRIEFENRSAEERKGLNLCDTPRVSIEPGWTTADTVPTGEPSGAGAKPALSVPPAPPRAIATFAVTVINHSGRDAAELYIAPQDAPDRGPDRLGMNVLKANGELTVQIPKGDQCRFNVHVVYAGKAADTDLPGLDLCASPLVTLPP